MALRIVGSTAPPELLTLPWDRPLEEWDGPFVVSLPRGLSRHIVRFIRIRDQMYVVKETREAMAWGEYHLLRDLRRLKVPTVEPVAVVSGRETPADDPIEPALITHHLAHSLPYRILFSRGVRPDTMPKLVDALVVLLVRVHLAGFFWGDCSLSNILFRRSAGEFAAYLVDAETGELHRQLSNGQRAHDLEIATSNVFAEILDLQAGGFMSGDIDAYETAIGLTPRYESLWTELTSTENFSTDEMWRIEQRIARLNDLGFDVDELDIVTDWDGATIRVQPKVVDPGHHQRRLQGLTGLDVEENQARRLLNDLDAFAAYHGLQNEDPAMVAHRWHTEIYLPIVAMVPPEKRGDLEPAEVFHEVLEHRWYLSERAGQEVDIFDAARDYVEKSASLAAAESARPL
jgi:hypothetical protein